MKRYDIQSLERVNSSTMPLCERATQKPLSAAMLYGVLLRYTAII